MRGITVPTINAVMELLLVVSAKKCLLWDLAAMKNTQSANLS
jgi:hypothetical protein